MHSGTVQIGGIAQHRHLGLRGVQVAQPQRIVDDAGKVGVPGRFAVAGKGKHIGMHTLGFHLLQFLFQGLCHLLPRGTRLVRTVVAVESTLAVDAVEGANLAVAGLQVDAK